MIYTLLQFSALVLTLEAAIFLALGSIVLTPPKIAQLCRITHQSYRVCLVRSFAQQTSESRVGVVLLLTAFCLQFAAQWRGPTIDNIGPADRTALVIAGVVGLLAFVPLWAISKRYASRIERKTTEILNAKAGPAKPGAEK